MNVSAYASIYVSMKVESAHTHTHLRTHTKQVVHYNPNQGDAVEDQAPRRLRYYDPARPLHLARTFTIRGANHDLLHLQAVPPLPVPPSPRITPSQRHQHLQ